MTGVSGDATDEPWDFGGVSRKREAYVRAREGHSLWQGKSWVDFHTGFDLGWDAAERVSTPRVVSSVAELDALPVRSVIRDKGTDVFEKWGHASCFAGGDDDESTPLLPATVLYAPVPGVEGKTENAEAAE